MRLNNIHAIDPTYAYRLYFFLSMISLRTVDAAIIFVTYCLLWFIDKGLWIRRKDLLISWTNETW